MYIEQGEWKGTAGDAVLRREMVRRKLMEAGLEPSDFFNG
jgi:hypothetical protein